MRYSRRFVLTAAMVSFGVLGAGCSGGGGSEGGANVTASGRFVRRDVTPANLIASKDGVTAFSIARVSASGVIAVNQTRVNQGELDASVRVYQVPGIIDIDRRTVTRVSYDGTDADEVLRAGTATAVSAQGDVYGFFTRTKDAQLPSDLFAPPAERAYSFVYTRATGKTTVRPYTFPIFEVSNAGDVLLSENYRTALVNFTTPETGKRPVSAGSVGDLSGRQINADGTVIAAYGFPSTLGPGAPYLWKNGTATPLPEPEPGFANSGFVLTDDDRVISTATDANRNSHLNIWEEGAAKTLAGPSAQFDSLRVWGGNTRGDILLRGATVVVPETFGRDGFEYEYSYLLWQAGSGTWLDITQDLPIDGYAAPAVTLLADGRIVCTNGSKIYTLTPR